MLRVRRVAQAQRVTATDAPYFLTGHMAPVADEIDAHDLAVTGALPPELAGRYFRNGPNPRPGEVPPHWFFGHGMIHGIRLRGGRAEWYRNRWVRTGQFAGRPRCTDAGVDLAAGSANTHVMAHAGKIWALVESSLPYQVTPDLDTVGACDFGGKLKTGMTAHPKEHPETGDLHFFGYGFVPPFLTYHRLSAAGELEVSAEIPVRGATMNHDFAITARHALFLDQPFTFQLELLDSGMPFGWDDSYGARVGVVPLDEPGRVRWFDVDPGFVFHVGNAHEDAAGRIVLEAPRHTRDAAVAMWDDVQHGTGRPGPQASASLHRWTLDPATGAVTEEWLDDRPVEFPTLDDRLTGLRQRYLYTRADCADDVAVVKYDTIAGTSVQHVLGPDVVLGEAEFVPSPDPARGEDGGWLMAIVSRRDASASDLLVLDAHDLTETARVHLPRPVPTGFHGSWIPDE